MKREKRKRKMENNANNDMVIVQGQKVLRRGYTTGTTATGATKYSLLLLAELFEDLDIDRRTKHFVKGKNEENMLEYDAEIIPIKTIKGITVDVEIKEYSVDDKRVEAYAIAIKESGDDPDVTHQAEISSRVYFTDKERIFDEFDIIKLDEEKREPYKYLYAINLDDFSFEEVERDEAKGLLGNYGIVGIYGGKGVGYVTKKGLAPRQTHSSINPKPRFMIMKEVSEVISKSKSLKNRIKDEILLVEISVKDGDEIAKKTFNPKLGILGGISILGTSGIVEPMSEQALVDTIKAELNQYAEIGMDKPLLICPGNYGQAFAKDSLKLDLEKSVKISNFIGETLDYCVYKEVKEALLVGHAGKLLKIAASVMNTHSAYADGRQEVMASHAAIFGAKKETLLKIMGAISIEEMIDAVLEEGKETFELTMHSIGKAMLKNINHRTKEKIRIEFITFTNAHGCILKSDGADELLSYLQEEEDE